MPHCIDSMRAPLLVAWQMTRACDLACLHCCTESAPGKRLPDELDERSALKIAAALIEAEVPYVMLCGGEPFTVPHFFKVSETLGAAGVNLKVETNGQLVDAAISERLARLPIRSVQVSLDGDSPEIYERQRAGGSLARAHAACRAVRAAGMPLEITFAPTRINIHEAEAVIERAARLGAFRFNTGKLMRIGTAARLWSRLCPDAAQYQRFRAILSRQRQSRSGMMDVCYEPFSMAEGLERGRAAGDAAGHAQRAGESGGCAAVDLCRPAHPHRAAGVAGLPQRLAEFDRAANGAARDCRRVDPRGSEPLACGREYQ